MIREYERVKEGTEKAMKHLEMEQILNRAAMISEELKKREKKETGKNAR